MQLVQFIAGEWSAAADAAVSLRLVAFPLTLPGSERERPDDLRQHAIPAAGKLPKLRAFIDHVRSRKDAAYKFALMTGEPDRTKEADASGDAPPNGANK